ncbi:hypothetical protein HMPREF0484_0343 [Klebsiella pneumoniae subsp. rhinoscleromatis ATCC 13884]|nr:hypothetical protein HMPREF0484_0343 [Klebsiella pneumoniae subsp. rhinoscleromatis ATCC 13884]
MKKVYSIKYNLNEIIKLQIIIACKLILPLQKTLIIYFFRI